MDTQKLIISKRKICKKYTVPARIHFNGVGYYWTDAKGVQLSKQYSTVRRLRKYAGSMDFE